MFNQNELCNVLEENGFSFDAVKKEWAQNGYIERAADNRYAFLTTIGSRETRARYVKILFEKPFNIDSFKEDMVREGDKVFSGLT